jgi:hypothetical protein
VCSYGNVSAAVLSEIGRRDLGTTPNTPFSINIYSWRHIAIAIGSRTGVLYGGLYLKTMSQSGVFVLIKIVNLAINPSAKRMPVAALEYRTVGYT